MTTLTLPRQPHSDFLARLRTVGLGLGGRGVMGLGLGRSSVQAAEASWWLAGGVAAANAIAVYQPKGAASLAASYTNLANPGTYDAAPGVAPTWGAVNGWTFNGTTQYLTTGLARGAITWSMLMRFSNVTSTTGGGIGSSQGVGVSAIEFYIQPALAGSRYYANGAFVGIVGEKLSGVAGLAGLQPYFDGITDGAVIAERVGSTTATIQMGRVQQSTVRYMAGKIQAVAIYNTTLTAPQVAAVSAAMAAL